jgi:hypothetical protein
VGNKALQHVYITLALILIFCLISEFVESFIIIASLPFSLPKEPPKRNGFLFRMELSIGYGMGHVVHGPSRLREDHHRGSSEDEAF